MTPFIIESQTALIAAFKYLFRQRTEHANGVHSTSEESDSDSLRATHLVNESAA